MSQAAVPLGCPSFPDLGEILHVLLPHPVKSIPLSLPAHPFPFLHLTSLDFVSTTHPFAIPPIFTLFPYPVAISPSLILR